MHDCTDARMAREERSAQHPRAEAQAQPTTTNAAPHQHIQRDGVVQRSPGRSRVAAGALALIHAHTHTQLHGETDATRLGRACGAWRKREGASGAAEIFCDSVRHIRYTRLPCRPCTHVPPCSRHVVVSQHQRQQQQQQCVTGSADEQQPTDLTLYAPDVERRSVCQRVKVQ